MKTIEVNYTPTEKQKIFHTTDASEVLYGGAAGGGKMLRIDTPIPTPKGFVEIGKLQTGDYVFGLDGCPHKVIMRSPVKEHWAYKFVFDDESEIVCDAEHLWFTYTAADLSGMTRRTDEYRERRRLTRASKVGGNRTKAQTEAITARNKKYRVVSDKPFGAVRTAQEIVDSLYVRGNRANHAIPVAKALTLPERKLPVDPYLFGLWLGDGASYGGAFTSADGMEQCFADAGFTIKPYSKYTYGINGLVQKLRPLGVVNNKHVPFEYLWASESQRLALLQGLMDTDGNCNKNGSAEFTNENKQLVDAAAFLVRSLGMKCTVREGDAKLNGKVVAKKYRIKFMPSVPVFRLQRKLERQKTELRRTTKFRYLVRVERVESAKMCCIAIDSADHLYLAGEYLVPTHNSKAIVMDALARVMMYPRTNAFIFRRTFPELDASIIQEAKRSYPPELYSYNQARHEMTMCNGSHIYFRHIAQADDMYNYQGVEIQFLYFDELTSFEERMYDFLCTRLRANVALGVTPIVRSASNPGGIGHGWVKSRFVDAGPYMSKQRREIYSPTLNKTKVVTTQYIPALATDNPYITQDYIFELERKPDALRKALLYGHWDAFEGQVFVEWKDDPAHYRDRKWTHVIDPFPIPLYWNRWMSFDYGYAKPFSCSWYAISPEGVAYMYREWYGWNGKADTGLMLSPRQMAEGIVDREKEEAENSLRIMRVADPSIFDSSRGNSVAQQMEPHNYMDNSTGKGVYFEAGDNARLAGLAQVHERLRFNADGRPMLYIFNTCKNAIRTIPNLPYGIRNVEDVDTQAEDHAYDSLRYFCMACPMATIAPHKTRKKHFDPYSWDMER